MVSICG